MSSPEDRLRGALHADEPAPLDPERIIHAAKHRRAVGRARVGAAAAVVVIVGAIGIPLAGQIGQPGDGMTAAAPDAATPAAEPAPAARPTAPRSAAAEALGRVDEIIPGRTLLVEPERWCVADPSGPAPPECAGLSVHSLRTTDSAGAAWIVVLAPSGPGTAVLQVDQPGGWLDLRTRQVPGTTDYWAGVVAGEQATRTPARVRALDSSGTEVWSAD